MEGFKRYCVLEIPGQSLTLSEPGYYKVPADCGPASAQDVVSGFEGLGAVGPLLLGAAGLLRGYRAAGHWGARDALAQFGAEPSNERVCIDRNRLTGGGITAGIDFGIAVAGHWAGESTGRVIELIMEYAPQPPYGTGRPDLADPQTLAAAHVALQEAMGAATTADKL